MKSYWYLTFVYSSRINLIKPLVYLDLTGLDYQTCWLLDSIYAQDETIVFNEEYTIAENYQCVWCRTVSNTLKHENCLLAGAIILLECTKGGLASGPIKMKTTLRLYFLLYKLILEVELYNLYWVSLNSLFWFLSTTYFLWFDSKEPLYNKSQFQMSYYLKRE